MVESLGFLLDVIAKDFHAILASIKPDRSLISLNAKVAYVQDLEGISRLISLT